MKKYRFDHWNKVLDLPDREDKQSQLRLIGGMTKGNLHYFVRRLLGKTDSVTLRTRAIK